VLKITVHETDKLVTLELEGRIAGPWVTEFDRTWRSLIPSLKSRRLAVNLSGVTYIEPDARRLLAEIYERTGAQFEAGTLLMRFYAHEAMQTKHTNGGKNDERSIRI
jgi:hypothetical protein